VQQESFELLSHTMKDMAGVQQAATYSRTMKDNSPSSTTIRRGDRSLCVHHLDLKRLAPPVASIDHYDCIYTHNDIIASGVAPSQFHLLTANPPYLDAKAGTMGKDAQRNSARFEVHGSISDYCAAAKHLLRPDDGLFYVVHLTRCDDRVREACRLHGLTIVGRLHVVAGTYLTVYCTSIHHETNSYYMYYNRLVYGDEALCDHLCDSILLYLFLHRSTGGSAVAEHIPDRGQQVAPHL